MIVTFDATPSSLQFNKLLLHPMQKDATKLFMLQSNDFSGSRIGGPKSDSFLSILLLPSVKAEQEGGPSPKGGPVGGGWGLARVCGSPMVGSQGYGMPVSSDLCW